MTRLVLLGVLLLSVGCAFLCSAVPQLSSLCGATTTTTTTLLPPPSPAMD